MNNLKKRLFSSKSIVWLQKTKNNIFRINSAFFSRQMCWNNKLLGSLKTVLGCREHAVKLKYFVICMPEKFRFFVVENHLLWLSINKQAQRWFSKLYFFFWSELSTPVKYFLLIQLCIFGRKLSFSLWLAVYCLREQEIFQQVIRLIRRKIIMEWKFILCDLF